MKANIRACIYVKAIPGASARSQTAALKRLIKQRGWTFCAEYVDPPDGKRVRVRNTARIQLIDDLLHRKYNAVLIWKLELLGTVDLLWVLSEAHIKKGVQILTVDGIDTTAGDGAVTRVIKALAAV